jgi:hypothetical protein
MLCVQNFHIAQIGVAAVRYTNVRLTRLGGRCSVHVDDGAEIGHPEQPLVVHDAFGCGQ